MVIKRVINNKFNEFYKEEFYSFKEVFDYCLEELQKHTPCKDCILFGFKILDSGEAFTIAGQPNGENSYIKYNIDFVNIAMK